MQEEVENRTLTLVVSGTKFTGRLFKAAITKYLAHRKEKKLQKQKSRDTPVIPHGKQTVKQLIGQNQGVSNIEITDPSIKEFEKIARKYGVDYNAELRGICNYYGMASNFCKLHYFAYLMEYSCLKTLASKHKTSLSKIIDKFNDGTGKWGVPYETKLGNKRRYFANYADCKGKGSATDYISNAAIVYGYAVNTLENRLKAKVCELCGTTESDHYEVHHINKLKNLKGKERWEIAMIAKHRKTLVVCRDCHRSIIHKK